MVTALNSDIGTVVVAHCFHSSPSTPRNAHREESCRPLKWELRCKNKITFLDTK